MEYHETKCLFKARLTNINRDLLQLMEDKVIGTRILLQADNKLKTRERLSTLEPQLSSTPLLAVHKRIGNWCILVMGTSRSNNREQL